MKKKEKERLSGLQEAARQLIEAMQGALADEQQFYRYVYGGKEHPPEQAVLAKADTKAIREMAAALKEMTAVVRNLYDLPAPGETPSPAAADGGKGAEAEEYGVILLG